MAKTEFELTIPVKDLKTIRNAMVNSILNHKVSIKQLQQQGNEKMARCFQRKCAEEMKINLKLYNLLKDNNIDLLQEMQKWMKIY